MNIKKSAMFFCLILLALMLFVFVFSSLMPHHGCEHENCFLCLFNERSAEALIFLAGFVMLGVLTLCISLVSFILSAFKGTELSLIDLRVKMSD